MVEIKRMGAIARTHRRGAQLMNGIFYLVGLTLVGVFVLAAVAHSPEPTIKKSGVPGLIQVPWQENTSEARPGRR
jgi:hypothetical protein